MVRRLACALGLAVVLAPGAAWGQDDTDPQKGPLHPVSGDDDPHDEFESFPLATPHDKHYTRAAVEVGAIVVLGFVDYLLNTTARGGELRPGDRRWDLRYDWDDLRGKLIGTAYELDGNKFATNYVSHPAAGTFYYHAARSNHLSVGESFLFAVVGSSIWEYFGELREKVSINDMIVTPVAGTAIGEATMQLSGFFARGKNNVSNGLLSFFFSPVRTINWLTEGAEPRRTETTDALGFPVGPWHRFEASAGFAATRQAGRGYGDFRFGLDTQLANLPGYAGQGRHARLFDDGNVSELSFRGALSRGDLVGALFRTRVLPAGFYYRDAALDERGRLVGEGAVIGLRAGFDYGMHDFDRDRLRPKDLVSVVSPFGVAAEYAVDRGKLRIETALDVYGSIAGVRPYALGDRDRSDLPEATQNDGYYHALGFSAEPRVEIRLGALSAAARMRVDTFRAIEDRDTRMSDRRVTMGGGLGWRPAGTPLSFDVGFERRSRAGNVGDMHASRSEESFYANLGIVF